MIGYERLAALRTPVAFRRLALTTTVATFVLIAIGGLVRATDSGLGCGTSWPGCFGDVLPPADVHAWIEHTHRFVAGIVGVLVVLTAVVAGLSRQPFAVRVVSQAAVLLVAWQALLGAIVVWAKLDEESVTLHLATALALAAMLEYLVFRSRWPDRSGAPPRRSRRFLWVTMIVAALAFAQMVLGATVTGYDAGLAYPADVLWPDLGRLTVQLQFAHRALAVLVGAAIVATWLRARARHRMHPTVTRLAGYASLLVVAQIGLGLANVVGGLSALTVVPHLAVGSLIWGTAFLLVLHARQFAGSPEPDSAEPEPAPRRGARETAAAYLALTKPRIIELLLVTTVPTMFIAARGLPPPWLVLATLLGGTLSAASANTINCYLDRDIDAVMRRTARRPLPAHRVAPADALRFGVVLGVAGFAWLAVTVNLLAAALATGAILFYVLVYTMGLKRRSTQNIVIGGAAGAVPVLVGWAAVTGKVELPALVLFAIIFYWTPPHFWALSLRYREQYEAARVPMLPVVRGPRETAHQILYYTLLLVAVTLLLAPAGQMGAVYLVAAVGLGAVFVWRAAQLRREVTHGRAMRLFRFSNHYLALLFLAMAVDAMVGVAA